MACDNSKPLNHPLLSSEYYFCVDFNNYANHDFISEVSEVLEIQS